MVEIRQDIARPENYALALAITREATLVSFG